MDGIDASHGGPQAVASKDDLGDRVGLQQDPYMLIDLPLVKLVIAIEAQMDKAFLAALEGFHLDSEVLDPVFSVGAASPRHHDYLRDRLVTHVRRRQG